jgi:hypothetical protein
MKPETICSNFDYVQGGEVLAELGAGAVKAGFDGGVTGAKMCGDLVVTPVFGVFEEEDLRVAGRQARHGASHLATALFRQEPAERIEIRGSLALAVLDLVRVAIGEAPPPAAFAAVEQRLPNRQAIEPGGDLGRVGDGSGLPNSREGDFLHDLVNGLGLADAREGDRSQPAIVLGEGSLPVD